MMSESKASKYLSQASTALKDRAASRDVDDERSMRAAVAAFNSMFGYTLTEEQGWHFMVLLKMSRAKGGEFREDDFVDGAAYFALAGEAAETERYATLPMLDLTTWVFNSNQIDTFTPVMSRGDSIKLLEFIKSQTEISDLSDGPAMNKLFVWDDVDFTDACEEVPALRSIKGVQWEDAESADSWVSLNHAIKTAKQEQE